MPGRLPSLIVLVSLALQLQGAPIAIDEIPFQYREGMLWIEVRLDQSEKPLNFLLDTGAGISVINLATADRLGLKQGGVVWVRGVGGTLAGRRIHRITARAGAIELPRELLAVDLRKLSGSCQCGVDGLIGADFFAGRVVQLDFDSRKVRILNSEKPEYAHETLPLHCGANGMCVPISVNGRPRQWVRVDTGCATALQWVTSDRGPAASARHVSIGLAEISIPQTTTTVNIGINEFKNVPTGLHATAIFPGEAGLLGNGLLSQFSSVTIDAKAGRLTLMPQR